MINLSIPSELLDNPDFVIYDTFYVYEDHNNNHRNFKNHIVIAGKKPVFVKNPDDGLQYIVGHLENHLMYNQFSYGFLGNTYLRHTASGVYYDTDTAN
jgi:hypothetical protein